MRLPRTTRNRTYWGVLVPPTTRPDWSTTSHVLAPSPNGWVNSIRRWPSSSAINVVKTGFFWEPPAEQCTKLPGRIRYQRVSFSVRYRNRRVGHCDFELLASLERLAGYADGVARAEIQHLFTTQCKMGTDSIRQCPNGNRPAWLPGSSRMSCLPPSTGQYWARRSGRRALAARRVASEVPL